jgi:hypothetical protein
MRIFTSGEVLEAPGILRNPVSVRALFDREPSCGRKPALKQTKVF